MALPAIAKPLFRPGDQYRRTTLGKALQESLNELILQNKMPKSLAEKVLTHFDVHMTGKLSRVTPEIQFKSFELVRYNEIRQVYNLELKNVEITGHGIEKEESFKATAEKLRIEAHPSNKVKRLKLTKKVGTSTKENNNPLILSDDDDEDEN